jgi:IMP dehydrogenase
MAKVFDEISRTFDEYLLIPNLTTRECAPSKVGLTTILSKYRRPQAPLRLNIPIVSAIMQSVSNHTLAIELARCGGMSLIFCSQSIERQADMVRKVKSYKAGFVTSDSNLKPDNTLADLLSLKEKTGHSTVAVTDNGEPDGRLMGIITSKDYRVTRDAPAMRVSDFMTPFSRLVYGKTGTTLAEANDILWKNKIDCLPIIDESGNLVHLVFRKDYVEHKENEGELLDGEKRLMVGAGVNTWDYKERVPALVEAGADALCIDSSHGYTEWQSDTLRYVKDKYGDSVKLGAGNVVDEEAFRFLVEAGADFVKVGIGGGSICITREQRAIGRGQASAVLEVAGARDRHLRETGE